jgi:hypothetical protein
MKIDEYVRREMFDESDQEEWCNYYYSLADFMWKKGILTDDVREKAIEMIDTEFGLELWAEAGAKNTFLRGKRNWQISKISYCQLHRKGKKLNQMPILKESLKMVI